MEKLNEFIKNKTGVEATHSSLKLRKDFGIDGDDALEFLQEFSTTFNVDISMIDFHDVFNEEGSWNPFSAVTDFFSNTKKRDLTVVDLEQAVKTGKLV